MFNVSSRLRKEADKEISKGAWKGKIISSLTTIVLGSLLFTGAFYLIYYSEGRVDIGKKVQESLVITPTDTQVHPRRHGKLVTITGQLRVDEILEDDFLSVSNYLILRREVERFAWVERDVPANDSSSPAQYIYEKTWTKFIPDHRHFKEPNGHENPPATENEEVVIASKRTHLSEYDLDPSVLVFPFFTPLYFNEKDVTPPKNLDIPEGFTREENHYFYKGEDFKNPNLGDVRIHYTGVKAGGIITALGKLDLVHKDISPFYAEGGAKLYHIFNGTREGFIESAKSNHMIITWALRASALLLMWLALNLITFPVAMATDSLPFSKTVSKKSIAFFTLLASIIICALNTVIFFYFWDHVILATSFITTGGLLILIIKKKSDKTKKEARASQMRDKMYREEGDNVIKTLKVQLVDILKKNPKISYKEAKKMAEGASIALEIFDDAWNETHHHSKTWIEKIIPTIIILLTIGFLFRVISDNKETFFDLVYDIHEDTKMQISQFLPTPMPEWAKELGLNHPENMKLNRENKKTTSVHNPKEGYYSLEFTYTGENKVAMEQANKMARSVGAPVAKLGEISLIGNDFAQYGNATERFGEHKDYSVIILVSKNELILRVTNENQLAAKKATLQGE